ncbi:MAG: sulfur oxidation c-type cytochrome SoxA [Sulfuriflexus sp.]|nr:sulfur oxidation c-type cytochrome SoxA [Sulfuriflexus sp.]
MSPSQSIKSISFLQNLLLSLLLLTIHYPLHAEKEHSTASPHKKSHHMKMKHGGGHHAGGHHGAITKGIEKFPTISYTDNKSMRDIQRPALPSMQGDPIKGKQLANSKGRCLSCHIMGAEFDQAGNVGPNLSNYANLGRSRDYSFQQIWDARAHKPNTLMPPLGTNGLLSAHEVMHLIAYLETLNTPVAAPARPQIDSPNYYVAGEDLTLADIYIEEGQALFNKLGKNGQSCASCHTSNNAKGPDLKNIATSYPKYDHELDKIMLIETRNNHCRQKYTNSHPYKLGSRSSNTLSAYVKYLSRNTPIKIVANTHTKEALRRGEQSFYKKTGQLSFSCANCHVDAANKWLRGQALSSIQAEGKHRHTAATWPKHFVALHDLGLIGLQQRIRHCQIVTQTYPQNLGSDEYIDMELYITSLANGLPMQAPTKSKPRGAE